MLWVLERTILLSVDNLLNSLDPDQDWQNLGPDIHSKTFATLILFLKDFFLNIILKKVSRWQQKHEKLPSILRVKALLRTIL